MMIKNLTSIMFWPIFLLVAVTIRGHVITTPRIWSSQEPNRLCVVVNSPFGPEDHLKIGVNAGDSSYLPSEAFPLIPGQLNSCGELTVRDPKASSGSLFVEGHLEGENFKYEKPIKFSNIFKTIIQTDNSIYHGGQTVQFRVLSVQGPFLKMSQEKYEEIFVENPSGIRIVGWLNISNENGLIHKTFPLTKEPELGEYKIHARSAGSNSAQVHKFEVEQSGLSNYEIEIKTPEYVLAFDSTLDLEVCANFTLWTNWGSDLVLAIDFQESKGLLAYVHTGNIRGCKRERIGYPTDLDLSSISQMKIHVDIHEPTLRNTPITQEQTLLVHRKAINFQDTGSKVHLKKDLPYVAKVKATFPGGSPALNEPFQVCGGEICKNYTTDNDGYLKIIAPPHISAPITISAINYPRVLDSSGNVVMVESSYEVVPETYSSPSNSYLSIFLDNVVSNCSSSSKNIDFEVPILFSSTGQPVANLTIQVLSQGQIIFSETFEKSLTPSEIDLDESLLLDEIKPPVNEDSSRGSVNLPISFPKTFSPRVQIIVWYTREDGEVVADTRSVDIPKCLPNDVSLSWSAQRARPGQEIKLSLNAQPNSLCSLGVIKKDSQTSLGRTSIALSSLFDRTEESQLEKDKLSQVEDVEYCYEKERSKRVERSLNLEKSAQHHNQERKTSKLLKPLPTSLRLESTQKLALGNIEETLTVQRLPLPNPYSTDTDAMKVFDVAGLYVLSNHNLEHRTCTAIKGDKIQKHQETVRPLNSKVVDDFDFEEYSERIKKGTHRRFLINNNLIERKKTLAPETWLWNLVSTKENGTTDEDLKVPEIGQEWIANAVCLHPTKGVGISNDAVLDTKREYNIDVYLPEDAKRGETIPVEISILNNLKKNLPIRVVLEESENYDVVSDKDEKGSVNRWSAEIHSKRLAEHTFNIKLNSAGIFNITLSVYLNSELSNKDHHARDVIVKPIRVEFEGVPKEEIKTIYQCPNEKKDLWVVAPSPFMVNNKSARSFQFVGQGLLGPTIDVIQNLGNLVTTPYGSSEHSLLKLAPSAYLVEYLERTKQPHHALIQKAIKLMEEGYQQLLNYKHVDGSYSAFGKKDDYGSIWLTSVVLSSLSHARKFIGIDENDFKKSLNWLKKRQLRNGCFESIGKAIHKGMKGDLSTKCDDSTVLTSLALISLIESGEELSSPVVKKSLQCLTNTNETNTYNLAVKAYALALAGNNESKPTLAKLMTYENKLEYISRGGVAVETASYALLTLLKLKETHPNEYDNKTARKVLNWLNRERNSQGGFVSSQDTIVAIKALSQFDNEDFLMTNIEIKNFPHDVTFEPAVPGCALIQTVLRYNNPTPGMSDTFSLKIHTEHVPSNYCDLKKLNICVSYYLSDQESNMAIMEIDLVSGYIPVQKDLNNLVSSGVFKHYEVDGNRLFFYVDGFGQEETCTNITVVRDVDVINPRPGYVKVYDYFQPDFSVTKEFYLPKRAVGDANIDCGDTDHFGDYVEI